MRIIHRGGDRRISRETTRQEPPHRPRPLYPRTDLSQLSAAGAFDWGNYGPGHNQLALAILADAATDRIALNLHNTCAHELIAHLAPAGWTLHPNRSSNGLNNTVCTNPSSK